MSGSVRRSLLLGDAARSLGQFRTQPVELRLRTPIRLQRNSIRRRLGIDTIRPRRRLPNAPTRTIEKLT
ncbi:hypothetical protein, partial [Nocardia arizonensis]|uniref:hypothetical protein n=1 Tax=Nocardia arizonensis TaxID=1141647 RepID=UPI00194F0189